MVEGLGASGREESSNDHGRGLVSRQCYAVHRARLHYDYIYAFCDPILYPAVCYQFVTAAQAKVFTPTDRQYSATMMIYLDLGTNFS